MSRPKGYDVLAALMAILAGVLLAGACTVVILGVYALAILVL